MVVQQKELIVMSFLWSLSIQMKRSDIMVHGTKAIVTSWWVMQTRMSPNWKVVVQRRLTLHLYEKKPTQYLMET
jgi:hypothetical protein